jgi:glycosyltransferase involved in cell wall biosynthesis
MEQIKLAFEQTPLVVDERLVKSPSEQSPLVVNERLVKSPSDKTLIVEDHATVVVSEQTPIVVDERLVKSPSDKTPMVIALLMIKNEEKIICRCIESLAVHVDAFCICDTGSTDSTIQCIEEYFSKKTQLKYKIYQYIWSNFGKSRSESFTCCRDFSKSIGFAWDQTYALVLDADMKLECDKFPRQCLKSNGHAIFQDNGGLRYHNTRLLKLSFDWKCTGVTHEYWDGDSGNIIAHSLLHVNDVNDGGCKDDKFPRDKALLENGLIEEPTNVRYMFYLARTLSDMGDHKGAIKMYRRRIKAGGWKEEIWYSMYSISKLYAVQKKFAKMEYWGLKAFELDNSRAENIALLASHFRIVSQHLKSWHYVEIGLKIKLPDSKLFLELDCYHKNFQHERTILNYYIANNIKSVNGLNDLIVYLNQYGDRNVYSNLQFYVEKVPCEKVTAIELPKVEGFQASSISIIPQCTSEKTFATNVRFVNYKIRPDGSYDYPGIVDTRNFFVIFDNDFKSLHHEEIVVDCNSAITKSTRENIKIFGVEDVRIFKDGSVPNENFKFIGTSMEFSDCNQIRQVSGIYNTSSQKMEKLICLPSPKENVTCEKNWIPFELNGHKFIYNWHPLTVVDCGKTTDGGQSVICSEQNTPRFFENVRGSSNFIKRFSHSDIQVGIVHVVQHTAPRKYYHMFVLLKIDTVTGKAMLMCYSLPFYFFDNAIEYVLGISHYYTSDSSSEKYLVSVSSNDCNPKFTIIDLSAIKFFS